MSYCKNITHLNKYINFTNIFKDKISKYLNTTINFKKFWDLQGTTTTSYYLRRGENVFIISIPKGPLKSPLRLTMLLTYYENQTKYLTFNPFSSLTY